MRARVYAAGTLCWRLHTTAHNKRELQVLLIKRKKYADWSFPKGKLDRGETLAQAAVRETLEETGYAITLGTKIGMLEYALKSGQCKEVHYWAAKVTAKMQAKHSFKPNSEVTTLRWLSAAAAVARLSYERDKKILQRFLETFENNSGDTFTLVLLRHAQAEKRGGEYQVDHKRPLSYAGLAQTQALAPQLAAYRLRRIVTSSAKRCRNTVSALAHKLGVTPTITDAISQDVWNLGDSARLRECVTAALASGKNTVICSHRPVLPDIAREIALGCNAAPDGELLYAVKHLPPAGFIVFHITKSKTPEIVTVETNFNYL
ncbi:NUDIX hydrolase [Canibacter sp. lx-45]|uniref:NUDIX hydrolase n=1 Tax=Canibacter zhuwentaonis TaxID=2837491 RepID=UPI001BDBDD80|nr:NUDIX hydrolase [Canibacter zhuwentaonis]